MGRKPKEYKYVKKNDGRKNNGKKNKGSKIYSDKEWSDAIWGVYEFLYNKNAKNNKSTRPV